MKVVSVTKYLSYAFLAVLALLSLVIMLILSPFGVKALIGFANDQQGLTIENVSGSFYSQVSIGKVIYASPQINITGDALELELGLHCLFSVKACIDNISAVKLEVVLIENTAQSEPSTPFSAYIELPVAAYLSRLHLTELTVYAQKIEAEKVLVAKLKNLSAAAFMHKQLVLNELNVEDLTLMLSAESANATNAKRPQQSKKPQHWIDVIKSAQYTPIVLPNIFVPINAEVQKFTIANFCLQPSDTKIEARCTGQTQISASAKSQTLSLNLVSKPIEQIASSINVDATVDLADAFSHDISVRLLPNSQYSSKQAEPLVVNLTGNVSEASVSIYSAKVRDNILTLIAQFNVSDPNLPLKIELAAKRYQDVISAWVPTLSVPISSVTASITGNISAYEVIVSANIDSGQASDIKLNGVVSLSDKDIRINQLTTSGDIGILTASFEAKLSQFGEVDGVSIASELGFEKLQLKPLVPQVDSQLNGNISVNANITPTQLWGSLNCRKVQGMLLGYNLSLLCDVAISKAGLIEVNALNLSQGDNVIKGNGQFQLPEGLHTSRLSASNQSSAASQSSTSSSNVDSRWAARTTTDLLFDLDLRDLSSLHPSAKGAVLGKIQVMGQADKPVIAANASIEKFQFGEIGIQQAQIDISIDAADNWQSDVSVVSQEIWLESMLAQQVSARLQGNLLSHTLSVSLMHPNYSLTHEFSGAAIVNEDNWRWLGSWDKGEFSAAFDTFTLEKPSNIRISQHSASLRPHCWLSRVLSNGAANSNSAPNTISASTFSNNSNKALCIEQLQYSSELTQINAKLAYNLKVPLLHYFPDIVKQGTSLAFTTDIELDYSPLKGIDLEAYMLMTQANITSSKHNIELVAVVANANLKDQILKTNVFAGTKSTGAIGLNSTLSLDLNNTTHTGHLSIDNFMLSPLQRFIPNIEKLTGTLAGNLLYDGPVLEPDLNGELRISDVELVADNYPYPLTNFNQTIIVSNKKANIEGEFELGAGTANYSGVLTLFDQDKPFSFVGEIDGVGMQLAFAGNEVLASPSLKIALDPSNLSLQGEVTIPNAQIKIDELPETAKSPSRDTIIIGKVQEPPILPIGLDIDVRFIIDPPKLKRVTINALDLKASLAGDLRVQVRQKQNPETNEFSPLETYVYGSLNVLNGSYEAYGQNLQIQKGAIFFSGAPSLPQFDITAVRNPLNTADNVVAGIRISGNPVVPKVELFSEPVMIQARQLSYLLQGTDISGGEGQVQDVMLVNMLVNFGVGNSENGVNRFGKSLGFDSLNVQTAGQGTNTQVQLTGRISDNVQVIYGVGLFDQATQVILRYQLLPQMYLEAKSGATSAVDVFYEWTTRE